VHALHAAQVLVSIVDLSKRSDRQGKAKHEVRSSENAVMRKKLFNQRHENGRQCSWTHLFVISTVPSLETVPRMQPITLWVEGGAAGRRL
jgi:hypothetical protein